MMMAMAAASSLLTAGTAAVATVGSGVAAAGSALGLSGAATAGVSSALKVAQGVGTAFQAFSQFSGARADAAQLDRRAADERSFASDEGTAALRQVTEINKQFLNVAGQQRAAFAANGIDLGSGSVRAARGAALDEANRQIDQTVTNNDINQRRRQLRARGFNKAAKQKRKSGLFGAAGSLAIGAAGVLS